jgi:hypothetical protein
VGHTRKGSQLKSTSFQILFICLCIYLFICNSLYQWAADDSLMRPEDSLRRDLPVTLRDLPLTVRDLPLALPLLSPESSLPTSLVLWGQLSARAVVGALGAVKALPPVALASWHAVRRSVHLLQHEDDGVDDQDDADDDDLEHVPHELEHVPAATAQQRQLELGKGGFRPPRPLVPPPSRSTPAPPAAEEEKEEALGVGRELEG